MKFTIAIAAVVALTYAGNCRTDYNVKCTPADMRGEAEIRWARNENGKGKKGSDAMEKADL